MLRVLGLGDSIIDRYLHTGKMYPGGNAYNFAVKAKQMGVEAAFMGSMANDSYKELLLQPLKDFGVEYSRCQFYEGENGYTEVTLVEGDRQIGPGNYGGIVRTNPLKVTEDDLKYIKEFQLVHTSCYSFLDDQIPMLSEQGVRICYDFSDDYDDNKINNLCKYLNYGLFSCETMEEARVTAKKALAAGLGCVIATAGKEGAVVGCEIGLVEAPGLKLTCDIVDTMGCGDAFITGFLVGNELMENLYYSNIDDTGKELALSPESYQSYVEAALKNSIYQGHLLAAKTCMVKGAIGYEYDLK